MNARFLKPLAGIVLALGATLAQAAAPTVINFNSASGSFYLYGEDDYGLLSLSVVPMEATSAGVGDKTLTTFGFAFGSAALGKPFDLLSLDLGNIGKKKSGGKVDLFYTVEGSLDIHHETLTLDKLAGLQTFETPLDDLTSFSLVGEKFLQFQVDNIDVAPIQPAAAVPEPESLALMVAGLAMLGTVARRRKA